MAIEIPDFSLYSNEDLLAIADEQSLSYIDAYNSLQVVSENPAQDGVDNFFSTLSTAIDYDTLSIEAEAARTLQNTVSIQTSGDQDKFDYAEAFCLEWFNRFYPLTGFNQFRFVQYHQTIDYDSGTNTITVNSY